jgi:hypothetical protein
MKNIMLMVLLIFVGGCSDLFNKPDKTKTDIPNIPTKMSMKLQTPFVTESVDVNIKSTIEGEFSLRIVDISNKTLSRENIKLNQGDNSLTIYTRVLPSSAYRLGLYDEKGSLVIVADFNKL